MATWYIRSTFKLSVISHATYALFFGYLERILVVFNHKTRSALIFMYDLLAVVLAWFGAYLLRFNFDMQVVMLFKPFAWGLWVLLGVQYISCRIVKMYSGMWIFASILDLVRVIKVSLIGMAAVVVLSIATQGGNYLIPRSIIALYPILLMLFMGGARFAWRMYKEYLQYSREASYGKPVVILGAGSAAVMLIRELKRTQEWNIVAILDDDPSKKGLEILGCRVVGSLDDMPQVLHDYSVKHVIMAIPSISVEVLQVVTKMASQSKASLLTVPALDELMSGRVAVNVMRPVKIEDLLGRAPIQIDSSNVANMLSSKTVLVTGAGGSIGSELCRQIARFQPSRVVLVEMSEFALYTIEQWFREYYPEIRIEPLAGDVKDRVRMNEIFSLWRPEIVFHAAAFKHVPLMELGNAWQAVRNNSGGTLTVAEVAAKYKVQRFVLISTDKAVNPTNVMGATKRLAEMLCELMQRLYGDKTIFNIVRFGNVLGSTGSVIPKFKQQIERGGPVTVTHPEINRYFMSIPEAAQLVLQAASMGEGGEVFVLDMGEPVKIVDLARNMIRLSGLTEEQIHIEFTGLRPGEKLYEELLADTEATRETPHPKLRIARSREVNTVLMNEFKEWLETEIVSDRVVRQQLKRWIPEYQYHE